MAGAEARALPTGTVTFVLADVEGSVALWEDRAEVMAAATSRFDALVDELVDHRHGYRPVEQGEGDSFVAVFAIATDAVAFALDLQGRLASESWATDLPLRVRVAIHTGVAQLRGTDNYMGPAINRCARIRALGKGGQVVVSDATRSLVVDDLPGGASLLAAGRHRLRGFDRREPLFLLVRADLPNASHRLPDDSDAALPTIHTTFVARDEELNAVGGYLDASPLVTLTGAGGSGKTRLAMECARKNAARFADGVAWADAATINDDDLLASCVASALDVRESPAEPLIETLTREIAARHRLLVLDNCEHVIDAAASLVARLIAAAPQLRVVATSREPLGVAGEISLRVPSLEMEAAVQLFVDRARSVVPGFEPSSETAPAIGEICRRLDGIPLAIELAAARMNMLTPRQIADGLTDRFGLLTGGSRTALPRQRTLEASVDWSYRLLSDSERVLLDRLSVFAGGFNLDAVRDVCAVGIVDDASALDLLAGLVDKSLVQVDAANDQREGRYRLLETIRHFGRQHLVDDPKVAEVRDRHLAHYLELAEQTAPSIEHGDDIVALARLDADLDNLRAAREWAHQRDDGERLVRLMAATWLFHEVRCHFEEALGWLQTAVAAAREPSAACALALYGLGDISLFTNQIETVLASGEQVVAIGEELRDPMLTARGNVLVGWAAAFGVGHEPQWAVDVLGALVAGELGSHPWLETDACIGLVTAAMSAGDITRAIGAARQGIASAERGGSTTSLQRAQYYLGWSLAAGGYASDAGDALLASITLADEVDETFFKAAGLAFLSTVRCAQGRIDEAAALAEDALDVSQRTANAWGIGVGTVALANADVARADFASARRILEGSRELIDALDLWLISGPADGIVAIAEVHERPDVARARLSASEQRAGPEGRWVLALYRGWLERIAGDDAAAEAAFTTALDASVRAGAAGNAAAALHELGVSACRRGQHERAARLFASADAACAGLGVERYPRPPSLPSPSDDHDEVHDALGDDAFAAAWAAGSALSLDEAARFALRGKGGRRRPTTGWESLTTTELDVVRLVSEGLSNPAIAERMFITKGTVKVHLSHVFTKLGVTSRAELAAAAVHRAATD